MPLRRRRPVLQTAAAGRGVAAQLPRDRRRRPADLARDLSHPGALTAQDRDLLTLSERQVSPRTDAAWPATAPVLSARPIDWQLIAQQYDERRGLSTFERSSARDFFFRTLPIIPTVNGTGVPDGSGAQQKLDERWLTGFLTDLSDRL